jgi:glycosyltransferase involved in cell wall biosynthesis
MGYGNCVVVNDTPENREAAGGVGLYFRAGTPGTLAEQLELVRRNPHRARARGRAAARRAALLFNWDRVTDRYEALFRKLSLR